MDLINQNELEKLRLQILEISEKAGKKILEIYDTNFDVEHKEDKSPLTAADMAAHTTICQELAELTPDIPVLSEESSHTPYNVRQNWHQYWLVDPLDGTREFIKRNGEFSVNIALIEDSRSILGVIHIPVTGISYSASMNNGAYIHHEDGSTSSINVKQTSKENITLAGSRSHGNAKLKAFIEKLDNPEVLSMGSSLKFCLVAEGQADIYPRFGPTSEWDTAAAQAIVEEAGGIVVDINFKPLKYNTKESLLNPEFLVIADQNFDWQKYL